TAYDPVVTQGRSELPIEATITASAEDAVAGAEAAVLCTEWEEFSGLDWQSVRQAMRPPYLIIDGRNALPAEVLRNLGFRYVGVGRGRPTGAGSRWGKSCE
ncbi:MAG TPA: UDP-glucose/GDP-mannose dehydrogenase family protein, partial [Dehalococcoidia bacterium]|nr:UDP-glucose/GDP-mannose dehydrogenase family protein [Dehalococcoidia bacterium]